MLFVEDSADDVVVVLRELRRGGYEPLVEQVQTEEAMRDALTKEPWELVLSDYNVPGFGALPALELLQGSGLDIPFIIVSGSIGEQRVVEAMKAGVHDYVTKDNLARLVVAIEREVRAAQNRRERRQAEAQVRASLKEKEVLLKELHHRVKNNLQIVSSLLNLASASIREERALRVIEESRDRINSMALIHEQLHQSSDLGQLDLGAYIRQLGTRLLRPFRADPSGVILHVDADPVLVTLDVAIPVGLIVNELVSNAIKHAFSGRERGEIRLSLVAARDGYDLTVRDDGVGLPEDFNLFNPETLGLQLVLTLTRQVRGTLQYRNQQGAVFMVAFPREQSGDLRCSG